MIASGFLTTIFPPFIVEQVAINNERWIPTAEIRSQDASAVVQDQFSIALVKTLARDPNVTDFVATFQIQGTHPFTSPSLLGKCSGSGRLNRPYRKGFFNVAQFDV